MGLFDKKYCDICGEKIGLLGNRKLEDGNCCKDCAAKLSPWMTDRRSSTIEEIKQHLAYREANRDEVARIHPTKVLGNNTKVYIDETQNKFFVTRYSNWQERNPDIIPLSAVTSCRVEVEESKEQQYRQDDQGKRVPYDPPRYEYSYEFNVTILVNLPWFDEISFELTDDRPDSRYTDAYREYERQAEELRRALDPEYRRKAELDEKLKEALAQNLGIASNAAPVDQPANIWFCPECGRKNDDNFCPHCGTKRPVTIKKCGHCGYQPEDQSNLPKFCPQCGASFGA